MKNTKNFPKTVFTTFFFFSLLKGTLGLTKALSLCKIPTVMVFRVAVDNQDGTHESLRRGLIKSDDYWERLLYYMETN